MKTSSGFVPLERILDIISLRFALLTVSKTENLYDAETQPLGDLRNYGVAERLKSVHPSGNPIIHSTKLGCNFSDALFFKTRPSSEFSGTFSKDPVSFQSRLVGVGKISDSAPCSVKFPLK
jgi:hypothetical protein